MKSSSGLFGAMAAAVMAGAEIAHQHASTQPRELTPWDHERIRLAEMKRARKAERLHLSFTPSRLQHEGGRDADG